MLRGGVFFSHIGAWLARLGVVRLCLDLLTKGRPGIPRVFLKLFGPGAAAVVERILGEVRKLPEEILPRVKAMWCNPKCFESMASHLACLPKSSAELLPESILQSTGWNTRLSPVCRKRGNTLSRLAAGTGFNWINLRLLSTLSAKLWG
jgi:hypothetical protein